jgi:molybdate transport system substrate-binding protein
MRILLRAVLTHTQAAELQVLAGAGIVGPLQEMPAQVEGLGPHACHPPPELIKMAASGAFELDVVPVDIFKDAPIRARFVPAPTLDVARVGIGVAVCSGAAKSDITTPEAFRQTLLKAQAVVSIPASATGTLLAGVCERLGIAEEKYSGSWSTRQACPQAASSKQPDAAKACIAHLMSPASAAVIRLKGMTPS